MTVYLTCTRLDKIDMNLVQMVEEKTGVIHSELPCDFCGVTCIVDGTSMSNAKQVAEEKKSVVKIRCHRCTMTLDPNAMPSVQPGDLPTLMKLAEVLGISQDEFKEVLLRATSMPYREVFVGDDDD